MTFTNICKIPPKAHTNDNYSALVAYDQASRGNLGHVKHVLDVDPNFLNLGWNGEFNILDRIKAFGKSTPTWMSDIGWGTVGGVITGVAALAVSPVIGAPAIAASASYGYYLYQDSFNCKGWTMLEFAAQTGEIAIADYLIFEKNASLNGERFLKIANQHNQSAFVNWYKRIREEKSKHERERNDLKEELLKQKSEENTLQEKNSKLESDLNDVQDKSSKLQEEKDKLDIDLFLKTYDAKDALDEINCWNNLQDAISDESMHQIKQNYDQDRIKKYNEFITQLDTKIGLLKDEKEQAPGEQYAKTQTLRSHNPAFD